MTTTTIRSLGFKGLTKSVPESAEEFDKLAGGVGAACREAVRNILYRSTLADFRDSYLHGSDEEKDANGNITRPKIVGLDEITGIPRKTVIVKPAVVDEAGKVTTEATEVWDKADSEDKYFDRVVATLVSRGDYVSTEAAIVALQVGAQAVFDLIAFDPSERVRAASGPKKTPKTYLDTAEIVITASGSIEAAVAKVGKQLGITIEPTKEALANAIWKDQTSQEKQKKLAAQYS